MRLRIVASVLCCIVLLAEFCSGQLETDDVWATDCGSSNPSKVDDIPEVSQTHSFTDRFAIGWVPPVNPSPRSLFYTLECSGCPGGQVNSTGKSYSFTGLTAATQYDLSIRAGIVDCELSNPSNLVARTLLSSLQGVISFTEVTETSFRASWPASSDPGVNYEVSCVGKTNETFAVCRDQPSGSEIPVTVRPVKDGFPDGRTIDRNILTKLFAIDGSSAQIVSTTTTAITVSWTASKTIGVSYVLTCKHSGGDRNATETIQTIATCDSLESGQAFKLTVIVRKSGGFDDVLVELPVTPRTKLVAIESSSAKYNTSTTAITVSWDKSQTSNVSYVLTCKRADGSGDDRNATETTQTTATCDSLESGQAYNMTVTVRKSGGFHDVEAELPGTQFTKLFAINGSSAQIVSTTTTVAVSWDKSQTSNVSYVLTCKRADGSGVGRNATETAGLTATCDSLESGQAYNMTVTVRKSGGFDDAVTELPDKQLTKLFAIDHSTAQYSSTTTAITVSWAASNTSGVFYILTCKPVDESGGNITTRETNNITATCDSLESGQAYKVTVTVRKSGEFDDAVTELPGTQLTKLFAIDDSTVNYSTNATSITVSWSQSITSGVFYDVTCKRVDGSDGDRSINNTAHLTAIFHSLEPGKTYSLNVTVRKSGGFEDAIAVLPTQLTKPLLITESGSFVADISVTEEASSSARLLLNLSWNATAATGADLILVTVTSELNTSLDVKSNASFTSNRIELKEEAFFSEELKLTATAFVEKSGLAQYSEESFIATLPTPPNAPQLLVQPDRRSITVTLRASSRSDSFQLSINGDALSSHSCTPSDSQGSCTITFGTLKPYRNYTLNGKAQFRNLSSHLILTTGQTLEDSPSELTSVTTENAAANARVAWLEPKEPNGVIRNYTVTWGHLDFAHPESEISKNLDATVNTSIELPTLSGHEYYYYVTACTGGGCGNRSDRATFLASDAEPKSVTDLQARVTNISVDVSLQTLNHSHGVVFEYVIQTMLQSNSTCLTAHIINCTNCRRGRENVTQEVRSKLEDLTKSCSNVVVGNTFGYADSRASVKIGVSDGNSLSYNSHLLLQPWTKYTLNVWPVNRAGAGPISSTIGFQTQEAPSGTVGNLRMNSGTHESVFLTFNEPVVKNGELLAYAIQIFGRSFNEAPCSLVVLNATASHCQLANCYTQQIIDQLAKECGNQTVYAANLNADGLVMTVRIDRLSVDVGYSARVTPVSQTLAGQSVKLDFSIPRSGQWVIIVVCVVVSVVVIAIVALVVVAYLRRRRRYGFN